MKSDNVDSKSEKNKLDHYQSIGYTATYQMRDGKFTDLGSKKTYGSESIKVVDEYRYEGASNPADLSILYILEMPDGSKGTLLLPYGSQGDGELGWFMKEVSLNDLNKDKSNLNKIK